MAFVFVVEDGTIVYGPPAANSYVTVEYADDFLSQNHFAAPKWAALTTLEKQLLLSWASRYLDQRATWNGVTTSSWIANPSGVNTIGSFISYPQDYSAYTSVPQQPMRWPRATVFDIDNNPVPWNVIPKQLMDSTCEMARFLIDNDRSTERAQDGLQELKVDVITMIFRSDYILPIVPSEISLMIRGLGTISSGYTNFAKIRRA